MHMWLTPLLVVRLTSLHGHKKGILSYALKEEDKCEFPSYDEEVQILPKAMDPRFTKDL